jgi:hypothetical protein
MRRQRPLGVKLWLRKSPPSCAQSRSENETVLNMKTAKALGLDVSTSILLSAVAARKGHKQTGWHPPAKLSSPGAAFVEKSRRISCKPHVVETATLPGTT